MKHELKEIELDRDWIELILTAKNIGLTYEEIQYFLRNRPITT
ncbi:anti-repressor SinI family protein [Halalkalibacter akibai]|nr:anti-repressor SinI family protein [Halalkalibacter akibai]